MSNGHNDRELLRLLVEIRREKGLSMQDIADITGFGLSDIEAFEAVEFAPDNGRVSMIRRYAHALGATIRHDVMTEALGTGWMTARITS